MKCGSPGKMCALGRRGIVSPWMPGGPMGCDSPGSVIVLRCRGIVGCGCSCGSCDTFGECTGGSVGASGWIAALVVDLSISLFSIVCIELDITCGLLGCCSTCCGSS